jgi:hypothetical protein
MILGIRGAINMSHFPFCRECVLASHELRICRAVLTQCIVYIRREQQSLWSLGRTIKFVIYRLIELQSRYYVRFQVLMVASMKFRVFWDIGHMLPLQLPQVYTVYEKLK